MFYKTTAILLRSFKPTNIFKGNKLFYSFSNPLFSAAKQEENKNYYHLYIVDSKDTAIKEGDWIYNLIIQEAYQITALSLADNSFLRDHFIKILASTNPDVQLPFISDEFVSDFIEMDLHWNKKYLHDSDEYYKGEIFIEYEKKYIEPVGIHSNRGYEIEIPKVNNNNEIEAGFKSFKWTDEQRKEIKKIVFKYNNTNWDNLTNCEDDWFEKNVK